jgi:hypothetical protein
LDGGAIFCAVNAGYDPGSKRITLGLSRALIELDQDKTLRLSCPSDSDGWWIDEAEPGRDGAHIQSDRVDSVIWLNRAQVGRES